MSYLSFIILLLILPLTTRAVVPANKTFEYVNEGEVGPYIVEYGGDYRVLRLFNSPFQLCFYNTTPNAYTLALRMATTRSESLFRWVWEANRGYPVRENATLTFGTDGNLILADSDGRVAWQTNIANKGVIGLKLLPNGNIVLHGSKGQFVWQSFDYPTDTLLVGQSLKINGPAKLVSQASEKRNSNGPYSLILERKRLAMYYTSPNSAKPILYFSSSISSSQDVFLRNVTLSSSPQTDEAYAYEITLDYSTYGSMVLSSPKYNSTLSFLRLGIDGNLKVYTYYDKVSNSAWEETFILFYRNSIWETECQLPERCGDFGLCEENQCVACPSPKGLLGWSITCATEKLSCATTKISYYKLQGVDHFMSKYNAGEGPMKESDCGEKCTKDCKCLGYFYHQETSKCWVAYDLKTLNKVSNPKHVGYIKIALK